MDAWQASQRSYSSILGNFQHQNLNELLVNVYEQLLFHDKKCVLLLHAWKVDFLKSDYNLYIISWKQHIILQLL